MKKIIYICSICILLLGTLNYAQIPIDATLKGVDANGINTFSSSSVVTIVGVCISPYNQDPNRFQRFIMDTGTGWGMFVDKSGGAATNPSYVVGDLMKVEGSVTFYRGLIEFTPANTTENIGSGYGFTTTTVPDIATLNIFDQTLATGGEYYEGRLVRLNNVQITGGTWPGSGSDANITITDASGSMTMRIDKDYELDGNPQPTGSFDLIACANQFDTSEPYTEGYQVLPRLVTDIIIRLTVGPAGPVSVALGGTKNFSISAGTIDGSATWTCSNPSVGVVTSTGPTSATFYSVGVGSCQISASGIQSAVYPAASNVVTVDVVATEAPLILEPKSMVIQERMPELFLKD
ncbi:MAG: hypothetical protein QME64_11760 [bacterium]|nr:hypothetical protein [bacterium]